MRCKGCQYSLLNLTGPPHRCPECGLAFDPHDLNTFDSPEGIRKQDRRLMVGVLIIIVGLAGSCFIIGLSEWVIRLVRN